VDEAIADRGVTTLKALIIDNPRLVLSKEAISTDFTGAEIDVKAGLGGHSFERIEQQDILVGLSVADRCHSTSNEPSVILLWCVTQCLTSVAEAFGGPLDDAVLNSSHASDILNAVSRVALFCLARSRWS
jgi:hypothetical protein